METLVYEFKNFGDLYFILGVCSLVIFFAVKYCIDVYQACNLPWAGCSKDFEKFFKIQFDGNFYYIKVLSHDYLIYKTFDRLHQKFKSKDEAWQFLRSDKSCNFLIETIHSVMMIHRLRLFYQLEK